MPPPLKLAKDLEPGDRVLIAQKGINQPATLLAIVESVQTVRRPVLLCTFRGPDGRDVHRQFTRFKTIRIASPEGGS